jgi:hypothetical protein
MKGRDKRIFIIALSVILVCGIAMAAYFGYCVVWAMRDLDKMEARRPALLYKTDHRELLGACRELSRQVATGRLKPGSYQLNISKPDPHTRQFPQLILDLHPLHVEVKENGLVNIVMSPVVMYGVVAYPEDIENIPTKAFKYRDGSWGIELIENLWYYDEDFQNHPEHIKDVEELLKKERQKDRDRGWRI